MNQIVARKCSKCGAGLPYGQNFIAECAYCGTLVEIGEMGRSPFRDDDTLFHSSGTALRHLCCGTGMTPRLHVLRTDHANVYTPID